MKKHKHTLLLLPLLVTIVTSTNSNSHNNGHGKNNTTLIRYTAYLIENAPYVWKRDNNIADGIIPKLIRIIQRECTQVRIDVQIMDWSMEELNRIRTSKNPVDVLKNQTGFNVSGTGENFILGATNFHDLDSQDSAFMAIPVVHSKGLAGIVHRDSIGIGLKLYEAMADSMLIIYNGLFLSIIAGVMIWWAECKSNPEMFPPTVIDGSLNGIWYAIVTMTTVGYGDMVPKTRLGKLLCIIYMLFCTLLIAALTSVYTERMTNTDVDFKGKSLTVVNGTWDTTVAQRYGKDHTNQHTIKMVSNYEEALEKVQNREVYATLIDYNVAAWFQHRILGNDLRFTKYIYQEFDQYLYIYGHHIDSQHDVLHKLKKCFDDGKQLTSHYVENYVQPITFIRLDMPDMSYAIRTLGITPIFTGVCGFMLVLVVFYACIRRCTRKTERRKDLIISDILAEKDRELTLRFLEKKLEEKLNRIKADIINDYKELLEDNMYNDPSVQHTERSDLFILQ